MALTEPRIQIENRTFDEIAIGESATLERTLSREDIELFAVMSGDVNPAHLDEEYAHSDMFHGIIAHGMWGGALISTLLGTRLPGPGTIYLEQTLRFRRPVRIGDTATVSVTAATKDEQRHRITFDCRCTNQHGEAIIDGTANVIAPTEKVRRPQVILPDVHLRDRGVLFHDLLGRCAGFEPIRTAIVHPVARDALLGALQAAEAALIVPVLLGPADRIRATASAHDLDISGLPLINAEHSHEAAAIAVAMARSSEIGALLKGSLTTEELMHAAVRHGSGLTAGRRMSHVWVMDVPTYPRPLLITDAGINIEPDLAAKRDIVQNAIDLAVAIGVQKPKVAILSAVETINPRLRSSLEAAALAKMSERGQITAGVLDGPLAFDEAVSAAAARVKGIASPVAGRADIVVVPDLDSGSMLVKQLGYLGDSESAGVVLGGRVPIALTGRADTALSRVASCALAVLMARRR